jgi:hypothetical protein
MPELEAALRELGRDLDFPTTPDFARAVGARLRPPRRMDWRRYALAAALFLAVTGAAVLAWQPARETVAGWLGVRGVGVHKVRQLPPIPTPSATAFGSETTLSEASAQAGFPVRQASGLGTPRIFVASVPPGTEVSLVYEQNGSRVVITELRGTLREYSFEKLAGPDTTIQPVKVNGQNGWWLSGHPHGFFYDDPQGNPQAGTLRLATNTLAWEQNGVIYRIEGPALTKDSALAIASGLR